MTPQDRVTPLLGKRGKEGKPAAHRLDHMPDPFDQDDGQVGKSQLDRIESKLDRLLALMGPRPNPAPGGVRGRRKYQARHFLRAVLLDGPLTWDAVTEQAVQANHSEHTLRRIRHEIANIEYRADEAPLWHLKEGVRRDGA